MRIFENKKLFKKLIILFVLITVISFCVPKGVQAKGDGIGGVLLKPITSLFLTLGDGIVQLIHSVILQQGQSLLVVDLSNDAADVFFTILTFVVVTMVVAAAIIASSGALALAAAKIGISLSAVGVGTVLLVSTTSGMVGGYLVHSELLDDDIRLPIYRVSPEEIFANKIPTFDVDFFNPSDSIVEEITETTEETEVIYEYKEKIEELKKYGFTSLKDTYISLTYHKYGGFDPTDKIEEVKEKYNATDESIIEKEGSMTSGWGYYVTFAWDYSDKDGQWRYQLTQHDGTGGTLSWDCMKFLIDSSGKPGETVDVFRDIDEDNKREETKTVTNKIGQAEIKSTAKELRSVIANWYIILRNLAIVILLSVLVYVGIRIIISSTSSDKAKYKQLLVDWVVAMCLLFSMNYIMSFSNIIVEKLTDLLTSIDGPRYLAYIPGDDSKVLKALQSKDNEAYLKAYGIIPSEGAEALVKEEDGSKYVQWNTNLMGIVRLAAQESKDCDNQTLVYVGYMVMFIMLVLFTVYFVFTYLKRVIYMAFLTLVAPLVAMTYPIDKMNDGKAQAFNMWLKEYIFNLLIQPLHLLLYTILVSSAIEFAQENILYSIVAIAFMIPAEKLMRKFFGFEKAQTPGALGGAAGAALAWSGINKLMGHRPSKGKNNEKGKNGGENPEESSINFASNFDKEDAALDLAGIRHNDNMFNTVDNKSKAGILDTDSVNKNNNLLGNIQNDNLSKNKVDSKIFRDSKNDSIPKDDFYSKYKESKIKGVAKKYNAERKYYGKNMKKKMKKSIENARPLRTVARVGAGALGAAAFATAGGIVGLTSGDPSKVAQYATAGAVGGYNAVKDIPESLNSAVSVDYTAAQKEAIERAKYDSDEEYERMRKTKFIEQERNNLDNIARLENKLGHEQAERFIEGEYMESYVDAGITDINDMMAAYTMEKGLDGRKNISRDEAMMTVKYSKQIGSDTTKMKKDDKDKWTKTISVKLANNQRAIQNSLDTENVANRIIDNVDRLNSIKNK